MASLADSLRLAGLRVGGWLGEPELALAVRDAFDPAAGLDPGTSPGANLARAGPMAVAESWDRLRHDSAWSQVLWVSEWPRITVPADFLHPLIFAPGVRRRLSLFARPLATDVALRQIRREKTGAVADSAQKARIGQVADLSDAQEYEDLLARERSVISGHADVQFTGFVTVTAPSPEALENAVATIKRAAGPSVLRGAPGIRPPNAGFRERRPAAGQEHVLMRWAKHPQGQVRRGQLGAGLAGELGRRGMGAEPRRHRAYRAAPSGTLTNAAR